MIALFIRFISAPPFREMEAVRPNVAHRVPVAVILVFTQVVFQYRYIYFEKSTRLVLKFHVIVITITIYTPRDSITVSKR